MFSELNSLFLKLGNKKSIFPSPSTVWKNANHFSTCMRYIVNVSKDRIDDEDVFSLDIEPVIALILRSYGL